MQRKEKLKAKQTSVRCFMSIISYNFLVHPFGFFYPTYI